VYEEYEKISPIGEKFKDLYESLEYAIFVPYAIIAAVMVIYLILVIIIPATRVTQAFGWVVAVIAILSYLASAVFIIYNHAMTILDGKFGESEFYMYLAAFALDVVSFFFILSVLMTYCMIKREERWDRLEILEAEAELEEKEAERHAIYEPPEPSAHLYERVIPDIEEIKEHEAAFSDDYERYLRPEKTPVAEAPAKSAETVVANRAGRKSSNTGSGKGEPAKEKTSVASRNRRAKKK
jgi:hypothetical protein